MGSIKVWLDVNKYIVPDTNMELSNLILDWWFNSRKREEHFLNNKQDAIWDIEWRYGIEKLPQECADSIERTLKSWKVNRAAGLMA